MRLADADILIIPGLGNSGPDHWQSRWQAKIASARRVQQAERDEPDPDDWAARIAAAANAATRPVILIAHGYGAAAALCAAPQFAKGQVRGAFLVAFPDAEDMALLAGQRQFEPWPTVPLAFPALLVASRNDPHCAFARAESLALDIGAALADAGEAGHINSESGHGPWPEGLMRLAGFLRGL